MTAHRAVTGAVLALVTVLSTPLLSTPAVAHGALSTPVSRAMACGTGSRQQVDSAACRAAVAVGVDVADWDNIRVIDVKGADRSVIPDGRLCSAGIDRFKGLDLARADWPSTRLTAGASLTFSYRQAIPHEGTFRLYVTRDGYDPTRPLRWADLEPEPFLTATDPPLTGGSYDMRGTLPPAKTGAHLIYTIWQNSNTPDTYYSCSDVHFTVAGQSVDARPVAERAPGTGPTPVRLGNISDRERTLVLIAGGVFVVVVVLAAVVVAAWRRRKERS